MGKWNWFKLSVCTSSEQRDQGQARSSGFRISCVTDRFNSLFFFSLCRIIIISSSFPCWFNHVEHKRRITVMGSIWKFRPARLNGAFHWNCSRSAPHLRHMYNMIIINQQHSATCSSMNSIPFNLIGSKITENWKITEKLLKKRLKVRCNCVTRESRRWKPGTGDRRDELDDTALFLCSFTGKRSGGHSMSFFFFSIRCHSAGPFISIYCQVYWINIMVIGVLIGE